MLLAALDARRPTRDVDLLALRTSNEVESIAAMVAEVAALPLDDGLALAPGEAEAIREGDAYSGVRVTIRGSLSSARVVVHVDVNVGDPVWPAPQPVALPRLLGAEPIVLLGYPLTMVLAEKIVTALQRGVANTRWRDFADLFALSRTHAVPGDQLQQSVAEVMAFRAVQRASLAEVLTGFVALAQDRWRVWRHAQGLGAVVPPEFSDVLARVLALAEPVIAGQIATATWSPMWGRWEPAGPDGVGQSHGEPGEGWRGDIR